MKFMFHSNGAAVFVKELEFFNQQKAASPNWDTSAWKGPITAKTVEEARFVAKLAINKGQF